MTLTRKLRAGLLRMLLSRRGNRLLRALREGRRRVLRRPHTVSAFLQLDDPYSYLLAHFLGDLASRFDIDLRLYLAEARGGPFQPEPALLAEYALADCRRLARELQIPFLDKGGTPPVEFRLDMLEAVAARVGDDNFDEELLRALSVFWRGDAEAAARISVVEGKRGTAAAVIEAATRLRHKLGHYNSAMLHYAGEWYWGVDRLHYLVARLQQLGVARDPRAGPALPALQQAMHVGLPAARPEAAQSLPPLELFYSLRSPYSYLALPRACALADAFGLELGIRPVLPMIMRGMQVPGAKQIYILKDAAREAARHGMPFGRVCDPAGAGVERCLAVFLLAQRRGVGREFLLIAGAAIWSRGTDLASDRGLRALATESGLPWEQVQAALTSDDWRAAVAENRDSLMASGCWGVPTLRLGDFAVWGQDRDWLMIRHIEDLCGGGDGILV